MKFKISTELELLKKYKIEIPKKELINNLILGDLFKILSLIPDNSIKVIVCDPPYNISQKRKFIRKDTYDLNLNFGKWDFFGEGKEGFKNYLNYIFKLVKEFNRILTYDGTLYLFCADTYLSYILNFCEYTLKMNRKKPLHWFKTNPPTRFLKHDFAQAIEYCICMQKSKEATFNFLNQNEMLNCDPIPLVLGKERLKNKKGKTLHPTQKPMKFIRKLIRISSNEGDLIGDMMAGTFTTSVVAKKENRRVFAIEKKYRYFKYGVERITNTQLNKEYKLKIKTQIKKRKQKSVSDYMKNKEI